MTRQKDISTSVVAYSNRRNYTQNWHKMENQNKSTDCHYFCVYLIGPNVFVVVPQTWIKQFDQHWEKFVNYGLNTTQNFLVFFSQEPDAIIGSGNNTKPNKDYKPTFSQPRTDFPNEGTYVARLIKFKSKYLMNG